MASLDRGLPLGDPALLCAGLIDPSPRKMFSVGLVPHYVDRGDPALDALAGRLGPRCAVIDVRLPPLDFLRRLNACDFVLSSSLHGLIVADALGVPNHWLKLSDKLFGEGYKFRDYYSAFGLAATAPLLPASVTGRVLSELDGAYSRPGLAAIQKRLRDCFPFQ